MSPKAIVKVIYISGMGILGSKVGSFFSAVSRSEGERALAKFAGAATGVYIGYIIASDAECVIADAYNEVKNKEEHLEVNNG